jgi:hypothetical protein
MATLDRILTSTDWDSKFPLANATILSKEVSDHNLLMVSFGNRKQVKDPMFIFEKWCLQEEDFVDLVKKVWVSECPSSDPLEIWQCKISILRKKVKGWNRNVEATMKSAH